MDVRPATTALALAFSLVILASKATAGESFANWAAVVVAGDDHAAHTDHLTATFDNARRDVSAALEHRGFSADNLAQFSAGPANPESPNVRSATPEAIADTLHRLAAGARGGCLIYLTSHGDPDGLVVGDEMLSPVELARIIDGACPDRPVVAVISACFSGVFVPALRGPDRLVLTAARSDRSSFGCSESDRYPYFDDCLLRSLPGASGFADLGPRVRICVARRERAEGLSPPSEPQVSAGRLTGGRLPRFASARTAQ